MAAQQFSLRWNNYSQHIVTALEELRADDELTDVTLSCEGQRIKAHKVLLAACSVFFKETFKENPCKHPVVILKGVTYADLQAVVQFMYNGQVNVSQERLPSFLQTAETLQIKGLTDNASSDKEDTPATAKKRPQQTFPSQASSSLDSIRQDSDSRPPTPKRKRVVGSTGSFATAQNSELPGTASVISASGNGTGGVVGGSNNISNSNSHSNSNHSNSVPPPLIPRNASSENSVDGLPVVKFEEQLVDEEEQYERALSEDNDNSFQDGGRELVGGESNSLGSNIRTSGAGERRPRYTLQPSNDHATGVVDATNGSIVRQEVSRDLTSFDDTSSPLQAEVRRFSYTNGHCSKIRNRLNSRSLSSSGSGGPLQQEDRVIKYAPLQPHSQDSGSNSSQDGADMLFADDGSESLHGTDDDEELQQQFGISQRRSSYASSVVHQKGRGMPNLMKGSNNTPQQLNNIHQRSNNLVNGSNMSILRAGGGGTPGTNRGTPRNNNNSTFPVDDLTVSSPSDMTTPSFSLTQQLLQQNVLSLISSNGTEVIKSNAAGGSPRVSAIAVQQQHSNHVGLGDNPIMAPYVCDVCGKRYVHHRSLNDHKKSHTGATRCPVCNKSFSKVANMRAHYAAQHSQIEGDGEEQHIQHQQNGRVTVK